MENLTRKVSPKLTPVSRCTYTVVGQQRKLRKFHILCGPANECTSLTAVKTLLTGWGESVNHITEKVQDKIHQKYSLKMLLHS